NDKIVPRTYSRTVFDGTSRISVNQIIFSKQCFTTFQQTIPIVVDGDPNSGLPAVAIVPLDHTTDPLGYFVPEKARAPTQVSFRSSVYLNSTLPGQGGVPIIDQDRYAALAGSYPQAS